MNKKTFYIFVAIIVIVIILVIFALRSCNPRTKEQPVNENGQTESDIERSNFINANIDFTCVILKNPALKDDQATMEGSVREVFKNHSLPVDDNAAMTALLKKYENDADVSAIIKTNSSPCATGGDPIFVQ